MLVASAAGMAIARYLTSAPPRGREKPAPKACPLLYSDMGISFPLMARAATTTDAFNAVAEPQRRRILNLLKGRERSVNELAEALRVSQTRVSKHLRVLREVGLVSVREAGQQRLYKLDARGLKPIHDWVGGFEEFWSQSFDRLNAYVKRLQRKEGGG